MGATRGMVVAVTLLAFVYTHSIVRAAVSISTKGKEYIEYDLRRNPIGQDETRITFRLKTISPSGLILFSANEFQGDFISLELLQGKLRYKSNLGIGMTSYQELIAGDNLNNNEWHSVNLRRKLGNVTLSIDGSELITKDFGGDFGRLDLDSALYVAGAHRSVDTRPFQLVTTWYAGCLENFLFDDTDLLSSVKYNEPRFRSFGDLYYGCPETFYVPISFEHPASMAYLPTYITTSLSVSMTFRTHIENGLLLAKVSARGNVYLGIKAGVLFLHVLVPVQSPIILTAGKSLNDGMWHSVEINVNTASVSVKLDDGPAKQHTNSWLANIEFSKGNATVGGGAEQIIAGFVGCIYDVRVDGTLIDYRTLGKDYLFGGTVGKCTIQDRCLREPCKHGGICMQTWEAFSCDCSITTYTGPTCEDSIFQTSCQEYKDAGLEEDSNCVIDPDSKGPINPLTVLCNVTQGSKAVTVFKPSLVGDVQIKLGTLLAGKYTHRISYAVDNDILDKIMSRATQCRQFIRYKCKNALLMNSPRGPSHAEWFNRAGSMEEYWGGAAKNSGKCACGENRTCADPIKYCNCDKGDDVWREDSGFLTDVQALPVSMLQFHESSGNSFFELGNLECEFVAVKDTNIIAKDRILRACRPVKSTPTTKPPKRTEPDDTQRERILNWNRNVFVPTVKDPFDEQDKNSHHRETGPNINVSVSVGLNSKDAKEEGLTVTMSMVAVIAISAAVVLVWIIIAVIVILKRRRRRRRRRGNEAYFEESDDDYRRNHEMCTFFSGIMKARSNRPVIEVHRHSIHCDTLEALPSEFRNFDYGDFLQPIATHIDLSYKPRKKSLRLLR